MAQDLDFAWREFGRDVYEIRTGLLRLMCNPDYQQLLPKRDREGLRRAFQQVEAFRAYAEDRMFERGGPDDTRCWYPRSEVVRN